MMPEVFSPGRGSSPLGGPLSSELPRLVAVNLLLAASFVVPLLMLRAGFSLLAPLVASTCASPAWTGVMAVSHRLVQGRRVALRLFWPTARRTMAASSLLWLPCASAVVGAWSMLRAWHREGTEVLFVSGIGYGLVAVGFFVVGIFGAAVLAVRPGLPIRQLFPQSARLIRRSPASVGRIGGMAFACLLATLITGLAGIAVAPALLGVFTMSVLTRDGALLDGEDTEAASAPRRDPG